MIKFESAKIRVNPRFKKTILNINKPYEKSIKQPVPTGRSEPH